MEDKMSTFPSRTLAAACLAGFGLIALADAPRAQTAEGVPAAARLAMPGDEHRWLEPLIGDWTVEMLVYPGPGAEPIVSNEVTATRQWTLDGRYLREELRGTVFGQPAARDGVLGYNRLDGRFEWVTVDTFEPGQMIYVGRDDASPEGFSMYGESTEAAMGPEPTGRKRELRFEFDIDGPDYNVQRIYARFPGQEEFLFVEQRFTRRASN
jgi:hypothetical protein